VFLWLFFGVFFFVGPLEEAFNIAIFGLFCYFSIFFSVAPSPPLEIFLPASRPDEREEQRVRNAKK